jgi:hypothetical protein
LELAQVLEVPDQTPFLAPSLRMGAVVQRAIPMADRGYQEAQAAVGFGALVGGVREVLETRHLHHPHKVTTVELDHLLGQSTVVAAAAERLLLEPQDQEALEEMAAAVRHLQSQELL